MENIEVGINKLSERDKIQFEELVNDCIKDTSWLREYNLNPLHPDNKQIKEILYNQMY